MKTTKLDELFAPATSSEGKHEQNSPIKSFSTYCKDGPKVVEKVEEKWGIEYYPILESFPSKGIEQLIPECWGKRAVTE